MLRSLCGGFLRPTFLPWPNQCWAAWAGFAHTKLPVWHWYAKQLWFSEAITHTHTFACRSYCILKRFFCFQHRRHTGVGTRGKSVTHLNSGAAQSLSQARDVSRKRGIHCLGEGSRKQLCRAYTGSTLHLSNLSRGARLRNTAKDAGKRDCNVLGVDICRILLSFALLGLKYQETGSGDEGWRTLTLGKSRM